MDKTVAIYTLGCKVNQRESQMILDAFREKGWQPVRFDEPAAVYVVNTCTVTQAADQKSRKALRGAKTRNPRALLVATGCYTETDKTKLDEIREIDLIVGNGRKQELAELAEKAWSLKAEAEMPAVGEPGQDVQEKLNEPDTARLQGLDRTRATLKLQDGCRQFCSYCIVPYVRGECYSVPIAQAVAQAGDFAAAGCREVVLLGIHLGSYGSETGGEARLDKVFERLLETYPQMRFRLGSLEPMEATAGILKLIRDYPNACKHLHLPLQSGSNKILRLMNRPYSAGDYQEKVREVRGLIPDIAITTDIIAGFPGEGEEDHGESLAFAREMAFSLIHVFAYSRRPGTPAADMPGQVKRKDKDLRSKDFRRLSIEARELYGESWVGRRQWVLIEEELGGGHWVGHSDNYMEVTYLPPQRQQVDTLDTAMQEDLRGKLLFLKITGKSMAKTGAWQGLQEEI